MSTPSLPKPIAMIKTATLAASGTTANQYLEIIMNHLKGEYQSLPATHTKPEIVPASTGQQNAERKTSLKTSPMQERKGSIRRPTSTTIPAPTGWSSVWTRGVQSKRVALLFRLVLLLTWMAFCLEWAKRHVNHQHANAHGPVTPLDPMVVLLRNATTPWQRDR